MSYLLPVIDFLYGNMEILISMTESLDSLRRDGSSDIIVPIYHALDPFLYSLVVILLHTAQR